MANYRPALDNTIPLLLLVPTYATVSGVTKKTFPDVSQLSKDAVFYGNFKTYGGTEMEINGLYSIVDTAVIETWYRPDIRSDCRICVAATGAIYDVLHEPENINMRNQFLRFKVKRVKGGA